MQVSPPEVLLPDPKFQAKGSRKVAICLDCNGHNDLRAGRIHELSWARDNVLHQTDDVCIMHSRAASDFSLTGWWEYACGSRNRKDQNPGSLQLDLYKKLFGRISSARALEESKSMEELVDELRRGDFSLAICSMGRSLRRLARSITKISAVHDCSDVNIPVMVLRNWGSNEPLVKQTCMSCGRIDYCDSNLRTCAECLTARDCSSTFYRCSSNPNAIGRKIAVGVHASDECFYAFQWAMENIFRKGDEIILIHVKCSMSSSGCAAPLIQTFCQDSGVLHTFEQWCQARGLKCVKVEAEGDPAKRFVEWAEIHMVDLAVVGSRGMSWLKRALGRSVSSYAVKYCHCPVLVVGRPDLRANSKRISLASIAMSSEPLRKSLETKREHEHISNAAEDQQDTQMLNLTRFQISNFSFERFDDEQSSDSSEMNESKDGCYFAEEDQRLFHDLHDDLNQARLPELLTSS
eukprot:748081-Hanusia_phi.AAC.2